MNNKKEQKKIMFVIPSLVGGGAERVNINLVEFFQQKQYFISLVLFEPIFDHPFRRTDNLEVVVLGKRNKWDFFKLILGLRSVIHEFRPDVVLGSIFYANIIVYLSTLFLKPRPKIILVEHIYTPRYLAEQSFAKIKQWLMSIAYPRVDWIVAISDPIRMSLIELFHVDKNKIKIIYNPIIIDDIGNKIKAEFDIHKALNIDSNDRILITAGRLTKAKRFDRLLRIFYSVQKTFDNVQLVILGKGPLEEELKQLSVQIGLEKRTHFVGFQENPYAWFSKSDMFVLSSDLEGFPMVLLEAMACGLPVVSTDCLSGPSEIITEGKDGYLVPLDDEKYFSEKILILLKNETLRFKFSEAAKQKAKQFDIDIIAPQYEKLFNGRKQ